MKYDAILFDYGGTLGCVKDESNFLHMPQEVRTKLHNLRDRGYLLGILSNTTQLSDAQAMRSKMQNWGILHLFEATMWCPNDKPQKPEQSVFQRLSDFIGVDPRRCLFVGDSKRCDGASTELGMTYLKVNIDEEPWLDKLEEQVGKEMWLL